MDTAVLILEALPGEDLGEVATALREVRLPHGDLLGPDKRFFCASVEGTVVGYVGLEIYGDDALLRSAVIFRAARGQGYGRQMIEALLDVAVEVGVSRVWLLTETAARFFEKLGFAHAERSEAPPAIAASDEFANTCPTSAAFMRLNVQRTRLPSMAADPHS